MNYKNINILVILLFIFLIFIVLLLYYNKYYKYYKYNESFKPEPIDRTRLYGSIFLDNLNTQIKNLTDPPIMYDTKRIELIRYNDLLL